MAQGASYYMVWCARDGDSDIAKAPPARAGARRTGRRGDRRQVEHPRHARDLQPHRDASRTSTFGDDEVLGPPGGPMGIGVIESLRPGLRGHLPRHRRRRPRLRRGLRHEARGAPGEHRGGAGPCRAAPRGRAGGPPGGRPARAGALRRAVGRCGPASQRGPVEQGEVPRHGGRAFTSPRASSSSWEAEAPTRTTRPSAPSATSARPRSCRRPSIA